MATNRSSNFIPQMVISVAVIVVLGGAWVLLTRKAPAAPKDAPPPSLADAVAVSHQGESLTHIETVKVGMETVSGNINTTGQVLYPSERTVKISPRLQGRVKDVLVRVGDHVTVGQPLAILDSVDAATAQTTSRQNDNKLRLTKLTVDRQERLYQLGTPEVTAAQAALDQAHTGVVVAKEALERTRQQASIGGFVDPPLETAKTNLIQAKNALVQAQSDLAQAERDHERKVQLVAVGVAAKSDLEQSTNVLEKAKAAVQSDQDSLTISEQALAREQKAFGAKLYEEQQVRTAEAAYRQAQVQESGAQTALRLAKAAILTNLQQARSDYQAALTDSQNAHHVLDLLGHPGEDGTIRILAPISGVITDRQVSPGQIVDQSQMTPWQMFVLSNTETVWVDADVYEKDITSILPGQPVRIKVGAMPDKEFTGTVLRIAPTLDRTVRAIKVRAEIDNRKGLLKDGMYASVTILMGKGREALTVPVTAVQHEGDNDFVYIPANGKYVQRKVTVGPQYGERYVITSGLKPGETVVSHGAIFLDNQLNGG